MRASGILMPVTSLPGKYGIGTMGKQAYKFIDFLADSFQTYWQILPIGPVGYSNSPYQSFSAFAGNEMLIDFDMLIDDGLIEKKDIKGINVSKNSSFIDYDLVKANCLTVIEKATANMVDETGEYLDFIKENEFWLNDYALFTALKSKYNGKIFTEWDKSIITREPQTINEASEELKDKINAVKKTQFLFFKQWNKLKEYANKKGVKIIGDIPIYVSGDSADVWANKELFKVDEYGNATSVAGCPPDAFSEDGQLWGNPIYDWEYQKSTFFKWWTLRLRHAVKIYDLVRIDHFRGLASFYEIPADSDTAKNGKWVAGPGADFINTIRYAIPDDPIIAEDLGYLTPDVTELLKLSTFPGMKVLQFAFDDTLNSAYLPHKYQKNCICYTGTHDNNTTLGWVKSADKKEVKFAMEYLGVSDKENLVDAFIRAALESPADTAIIPIQDYLNLGSEARINTPSTIGNPNWCWRIEEKALTKALAKKLARMSLIYGRKQPKEE